MKRLLTGAAAAALLCTTPALALEVPIQTTLQTLNGIHQCVKVYSAPPSLDPETLIEPPFDYDGRTYTFTTIVKQENRTDEEKPHTETVTAETAKKDMATVLAALPSTMEYDDGTYRGTLTLDHTTIKTEAAGYKSESYTIRTTKEIDHLDSNDMAYVPGTTVKDGVTLSLSAVDWQVQGTGLSDDSLTPTSYKAVATYSGKGYSNVATGYVTTASYTGTIARDEVDSITYTVTYTGEEVPPPAEIEETQPEEPQLEVLNEDVRPALPPFMQNIHAYRYPIGGGMIAVIAAAIIGRLLLRRREHQTDNTDEEDETEDEED